MRRIMRTLKIEEIGGVDFPAQVPARVTVMKRDETKQVTVETVTKKKSAGSSGGGQETHVEKIDMTDAEKAAAEKAQKAEKARVEKLEADLVISKAFGEFTDVQKAHYGTLDEEAKSAFLKQSPKEREEVIAKAAEVDTVVYTDSDGNEYRKSDDQRTISAVKRADAAIKVAQAAEDRANRVELTKRADTLLKHLPGDEEVKVSVLKAIDSITDEDTRTKALEMLKVNGEKLAEAFTTRGTQSGGTVRKSDDQLEVMSKKYADDNKVDIVSARVKVLESPEGQAIYNQTLAPASAQ